MSRRAASATAGWTGAGPALTHRVLLEIVPPPTVDQLLPQVLLEPACDRWIRQPGVGAQAWAGIERRWRPAVAGGADLSYSPLCSSFVWMEFFSSCVAIT